MPSVTNDKEGPTTAAPLALSAVELAKALGVGVRTIRRLDASGQLPKPVKVGRLVRWPVAEIEQWLKRGAPDRAEWEILKAQRTGRHSGRP